MDNSNAVRNSYPNKECPDCGENIPYDVIDGEECENCGHIFYDESKQEV